MGIRSAPSTCDAEPPGVEEVHQRGDGLAEPRDRARRRPPLRSSPTPARPGALARRPPARPAPPGRARGSPQRLQERRKVREPGRGAGRPWSAPGLGGSGRGSEVTGADVGMRLRRRGPLGARPPSWRRASSLPDGWGRRPHGRRGPGAFDGAFPPPSRAASPTEPHRAPSPRIAPRPGSRALPARVPSPPAARPRRAGRDRCRGRACPCAVSSSPRPRPRAPSGAAGTRARSGPGCHRPPRRSADSRAARRGWR